MTAHDNGRTGQSSQRSVGQAQRLRDTGFPLPRRRRPPGRLRLGCARLPSPQHWPQTAGQTEERHTGLEEITARAFHRQPESVIRKFVAGRTSALTRAGDPSDRRIACPCFVRELQPTPSTRAYSGWLKPLKISYIVGWRWLLSRIRVTPNQRVLGSIPGRPTRESP